MAHGGNFIQPMKTRCVQQSSTTSPRCLPVEPMHGICHPSLLKCRMPSSKEGLLQLQEPVLPYLRQESHRPMDHATAAPNDQLLRLLSQPSSPATTPYSLFTPQPYPKSSLQPSLARFAKTLLRYRSFGLHLVRLSITAGQYLDRLIHSTTPPTSPGTRARKNHSLISRHKSA